MITVLAAGALQGYSGTDHLIDDADMKEIVGLNYRTVKEALAAAESRCGMYAHNGQPYRRHPYVWVEVRHARGEVREYQSV